MVKLKYILVAIIVILISLPSQALDRDKEKDLLHKGVQLYRRPYSEIKHLLKGRYMDEYSMTASLVPPQGRFNSVTVIPFGNENGIVRLTIKFNDPNEGGVLAVDIRTGDRDLIKSNTECTMADGRILNGQVWRMKRKHAPNIHQVFFVDDGETVLISKPGPNNIMELRSSALYYFIKDQLQMIEDAGFFE